MTLDIMLPYWGDEGHLLQAVRSVLAQTDPDWRLTVIDDAYPSEIVPAFFAELDDRRVRYLRNVENQGIIAAFRRSAALAEEPWMTVFGSDDVMHPEYVSVVKRLIDAHPDVDIVQPGVRVIGSDGRPTLPLVDRVKQRLLAPRAPLGARVLSGQELATSLIRGNWLYWPSLVFRTETIQRIGFTDGLPIILDLALLMDIAFESGSLVYQPEPVVFSYRRHGASASQRTLLDGTRFADERGFYAATAQRARRQGWGRTARAARLRLMTRLHAATELPAVVRHGSRAGVRATLGHLLGR